MDINTNYNEEEILDHFAGNFNISQTFSQPMIPKGYS